MPHSRPRSHRQPRHGAALACLLALLTLVAVPTARAQTAPADSSAATQACTDVPSRDPDCAESAAFAGAASSRPSLQRMLTRASYPVKPEAPAAPAGGGTTQAAADAARAILAGKGVYVCNEVSGIPGPNCGSAGAIADATLISRVRTNLGANQLWARCGDSRRGFPQAHKDALARIRPIAAAAGVRLICWDVPNFWDVQEDARRLAEMSSYADAVASDLESGVDTVGCTQATSGCGYAGPELETDKGSRWGTAYAGWFRAYVRAYNPGAGDNYPAVVVTMQPQTHSGYPFNELAGGFAAASPMMYRGVTWFTNNDPGQGEIARTGNPFVATGLRVLKSRGFGDSAHVVHVTGMTYDGGPDIFSHENQIRTDIGATQANGGAGFAGFDFGDLMANDAWAAAFRQTTWIGAGTLYPFGPGFAGGASVAGGALRAATPGLLAFGAGPGGGPDVRVTRADGTDVGNFFAYDAGWTGGVDVAVGDLDRDGTDDVVTGPNAGGGPHVRTFAADGTPRAGWFAFGAGFGGGVRVASGDVDGDGYADVVAAAGPGGGPHVRIFRADGTPIGGWFPYDPAFGGGVRVAVGDVDGDGRAEIITAPGRGGGPHVRVIRADGTPRGDFFAYAPGFTGGVEIAAADLDGDGKAEIITGPGPGGGPHLRVIKWDAPGVFHEVTSWFPYAPNVTRGLRVGAVPQGTGVAAKMVVGLGPGAPTVAIVRRVDGTD